MSVIKLTNLSNQRTLFALFSFSVGDNLSFFINGLFAKSPVCQKGSVMRLQISLALTILGVIVSILPTSAVAEGNCQNDDRAYPSGATVCECPRFSGRVIGFNSCNGRIISRRMVREQAASRLSTEVCVKLNFGNSNDLHGAINRFGQDLYPAAIGSASNGVIASRQDVAPRLQSRITKNPDFAEFVKLLRAASEKNYSQEELLTLYLSYKDWLQMRNTQSK